MNKLFCGLAAVSPLLLSSVSLANVTVSVGPHIVQAGKTNETVTLLVTSGDMVDALNISAQIGIWDSGDLYVATGPIITRMELVSGTIVDGAIDPAFAQSTMLASRLWTNSFLADNAVAANGVLATLTLDTTGLSSGIYELRLMQTTNGDSDFGITSAMITNGSVEVAVPEPSCIGVLALAGLALGRRMRKS